MKCNGCGTSMLVDRTENSERASTQWHRCPLCSKVRLTSQPAVNCDMSSNSEYADGPMATTMRAWRATL